MTEYYFEVVGSKDSDNGPYFWKVFSYDVTGDKEVIKMRSQKNYYTRDDAYDAGLAWCDDSSIRFNIVW